MVLGVYTTLKDPLRKAVRGAVNLSVRIKKVRRFSCRTGRCPKGRGRPLRPVFVLTACGERFAKCLRLSNPFYLESIHPA